MFVYLFTVWVFFHKNSRFAEQQGKGESVSSTRLYHLLQLDS